MDIRDKSESLFRIKEYRKNILKIIYSRLTEGQRMTFCRMYGNKLDDIPDEKIELAIAQIDYTLNNFIGESDVTLHSYGNR